MNNFIQIQGIPENTIIRHAVASVVDKELAYRMYPEEEQPAEHAKAILQVLNTLGAKAAINGDYLSLKQELIYLHSRLQKLILVITQEEAVAITEQFNFYYGLCKKY